MKRFLPCSIVLEWVRGGAARPSNDLMFVLMLKTVSGFFLGPLASVPLGVFLLPLGRTAVDHASVVSLARLREVKKQETERGTCSPRFVFIEKKKRCFHGARKFGSRASTRPRARHQRSRCLSRAPLGGYFFGRGVGTINHGV